MSSFLAFSSLMLMAIFSNIDAQLQPPYQITFTPFDVIADCNLNNPNDFSAFRGYEPMLILDAMNIANLTYGVDITFQCVLTIAAVTVSDENASLIGSF